MPLIDNAVLYQQMALRGINASRLAGASGLTPETLSRIRRGYVQVRPSTMAKIAKGLEKFPVIEGIDGLLVAPQAEDKMVGGTHVDQPPVRRVPKPRRPLRIGEGTPPERVGRWRVIDLTPRSRKIAPVENNQHTEAMKEA